MKKLFKEFQDTNKEKWLAQIEKDLKGKSIEALKSKPEHDLEIVAYHHREDFDLAEYKNEKPAILDRSNNSWRIRVEVSDKSNSELLELLNKGVDAIGIDMEKISNFKNLTQDVLFEHINTDLKFSQSDQLKNIDVHSSINLNFDILAINGSNGKWEYDLSDYIQFYKSNKEHNNLWVSGSMYGDAGASTIQELAFTLAHLNEYLQALKDEGVDLNDVNSNFSIELSVNENYFVNIAKFRAIHSLIHTLLKGYGIDGGKIGSLYGKTGIRFLAQNDSNTNLLRETTQAMSAIIGGCNVLTIVPYKDGDQNRDVINERMAKNIQLILKEESYLDKVIDISAGSYYIENLTNQLLKKAWELFLAIEEDGGLIESLKGNKIQERIDRNKERLIDDLNSAKKTFLGVNKFQNGMEKWKSPTIIDEKGEFDFFPITEFCLENYYEKNTVINE